MCVFMHVWCGCRCCSVSAHDSLSEPPAHHLGHVSWPANPSNLPVSLCPPSRVGGFRCTPSCFSVSSGYVGSGSHTYPASTGTAVTGLSP